MNVLLIEPDRVLATIYQRALQSEGHSVAHSVTAQGGVFAADDQMPDIVFLELQLAGHSGIEFLYEFRTYPEWRKVPVVVLSHVPAHEVHSSSKLLKDQLGVVGYHYKPQTRLSDILRIVATTVVAPTAYSAARLPASAKIRPDTIDVRSGTSQAPEQILSRSEQPEQQKRSRSNHEV